jgi:hypothetical protein
VSQYLPLFCESYCVKGIFDKEENMRVVNCLYCNLFLAVFCCSASLGLIWNPDQSWQMFDSGYQTYNYAPSSIISDDGTVESHFYCSNKDAGVVIDHIYLTQRISGIWQPKTLVLSPGAAGTWDSVHVCDPAVVQGSFNYDGTNYQWAMFYLGCDRTDGNHNQIGVAFANNLNGPWIKYASNPIILGASTWWGTGQPSATSIDGQGQMLLFYTQGDSGGTRVRRRQLDFSNMSSKVIGTALTLPTAGLTEIDGSSVIFHDADFIYDSIRDKFFVCRERHPYDDVNIPTWIASQVQVACIDGAAVWSGSGTWKVLGNISIENSGYPRNHNSGILRTGYGGLPDFAQLRVIFAVGVQGNNWLWSYRLHSITGDLVSFDPAGNDGKVNFTDYAVWAQYWGQTGCEPNTCGYYADYNFDGHVDYADLGFFAEYWLMDF